MARDPELPVYIYALIDPRTKHVRYVGQSQNPEDRLRNHVSSAPRAKFPDEKAAWLKELRALKLKPDWIILQETDNANADEVERAWISIFATRTPYLVNASEGRGGLNTIKGLPSVISGAEFKARREALGMRAWQLGIAMHVSGGAVSRWERESRPITPRILAALQVVEEEERRKREEQALLDEDRRYEDTQLGALEDE